MRRKDYYWSLYHIDERNQLDDLRTDQVEAVFAALPKREHDRWLVWKEGFLAWKSLVDFPVLLQELRKAGASLDGPKAPEPPSRPAAEVEREREEKIAMELTAETESSLGTLEFDDRAPNRQGGSGRRDGGRRYAGRFEVQIVGPETRYRTRTVNASLNGVQLADPLPESMPRYFTVEMKGPDGMVIAMLCSAIRNPDGSPVTRLKIESNDHVNVLRSWLIKT